MAEHLENESEVSDVDPEELANLIKGVDDMDDELFGFNPKKKSEVPKPREELKPKIEKEKNKSTIKDFSINDPLADISLSDDDFYGVTESGSKPKGSTLQNVSKPEAKLTDLPKTSPLKSSRAKKIANLFGLEEEPNENATKDEKVESASDWLGIKISPEKNEQNEKVEKRTEISTPDVDEFKKETDGGKKSVVFDVGGALNEPFQTRRRKSSVERDDRFQNLGKDNLDDVFGLLEDKRKLSVESKTSVPRGIMDDILGETPVNRGRTSRQHSEEKKPKGESTNLWSKPSDQTTSGQYTPSLGTSRRPGFSRRRDTSPLSNPNTPPTSLKVIEDDWLTPTQTVDVTKDDKTRMKQQSPVIKDNTPSKLPPWLGGSSAGVSTEPAQRTVLQDTGQKVSVEISQGAMIEPEQQRVEVTPEVLLAASNAQNQQTALALQRTEAQLIGALQLKQQRESMDAVCHRQTQLLELQERQLDSLVKQHLTKQTEVEMKLHAQQDRIGVLLQTLMASHTHKPTTNLPTLQHMPLFSDNLAVAENTLQNGTVVAEIEAKLNKLKIENQDLKVRLEFLEKTHQNELATLAQVHHRDVEMWRDQEERYKTCSRQMQEDYEARILRLQTNTTEQLRLEKEWLEKLQEERLTDLKMLGEFYRVQFEQMSEMYKMLPRDVRRSDLNSLVAIKRPSDEVQLTAREAALIQKEVQLAAMQEKLTTQKDNLEVRTEELEEKMEQEKIKYEEMMRQLKREKRELTTKEQLWSKDQEHLKEQYENQMRFVEELREKVVKEQSKLVEERLHLAEERARIEALSKLQGVAPSASFDILQARAEVHGALEATRSVEMELGEERHRLRELQRSLELDRWKLQEYERDVAARAEHLDHVLQVSESNKEDGLKALEQAKKVQQTAEERFAEMEEKMKEVLAREQKLMKEKLEFTQEEMRLNKRREQLDQILPELSAAESLSLQPVSKNVIDPKMLIMKLKAEKELDSFSR